MNRKQNILLFGIFLLLLSLILAIQTVNSLGELIPALENTLSNLFFTAITFSFGSFFIGYALGVPK